MSFQDGQYELLRKQGNDKFKLKDYEHAAQLYTSAISMKEDEPVAYSNRAQCYINLGRYYEALADCNRAAALDGNAAKTFYRRAIANKNLYRFSRALEDLEHVSKLDPDFTGTKKEADSIKKLIADDTRVSVTITDKPTQFRSDKPMKKLILNNVQSGQKLYSHLS